MTVVFFLSLLARLMKLTNNRAQMTLLKCSITWIERKTITFFVLMPF